jgi:hypothetical protein
MGGARAWARCFEDNASERAALRCCEFIACCAGLAIEEREGFIFLQPRDNCATRMGNAVRFYGEFIGGCWERCNVNADRSGWHSAHTGYQ